MPVVSVHEAETQLSRLLAQVEAGERSSSPAEANPSPGSCAASPAAGDSRMF